MEGSGHWGDGVTLLAAARHLHCDVRVISNRDYPDVFLKPDSSNCDGEELVQLVLGHIFEDQFASLEPGTALKPVNLTYCKGNNKGRFTSPFISFIILYQWHKLVGWRLLHG